MSKTQAQEGAPDMGSPATKRYKLKNGAKSIAFPNLAEYTQEHLNGEHGEMIVRAMKKTDAKYNTKHFERLVEELK